MAADKLTVGVAGLGLGKTFVRSLAANASVDRILVCDPDADLSRSVSDEIPEVASWYADLAEMLEKGRPDAMCVVTPDHLHRPHTELCLQAGCHVLQTKPLATNLEDARSIVRAAERADRVVMVAHERRFRANYRTLRDRIESGELGDVIHLRIDAIQDKRGQFARSPWYASAEAGRTALVGSGIHEVDLLRFLIGRPVESVTAFSSRLGPLEFPKDKTTAAVFGFEGGAIGQVTVTYEAHPPKGMRPDDHFRLVASNGMAYADRVGVDGGEWEWLPTEDSDIGAGVRGAVDGFAKTIVTGGEPAVSARDAFDSLAACEAADRSAEEGRPVTPSACDDRIRCDQ